MNINNQSIDKQTCIICLEEQSENDIENNNQLIKYNHCGLYYIHNKCLNNWNSNQCIICRKNLNEITVVSNNNNNNEESDNDIVDIIISRNSIINRETKIVCINICLMLNIIGFALFFVLN